MQVPFVNLSLQYKSIQHEIDGALQAVFTKSQFIGGDFVRNFEQRFSHALNTKHCIGTGNGTDSLFIILKSLGIGPGDEVITPAFSCIASAEVVSLTGANIVFADVDPNFYTISPADIEKKISPRTKAVIAVHLYGQAAHVTEIKQLCEKHNLFLIEDCAQAHVTQENGKIVGSFGIASAFSFYPTKNLGAYGDAGCILTQNDQLEEKMRRFSNHGVLQRDDHNIEGTNSRLDALQAAVLSVKLNHLPAWNRRKSELAEMYSSQLKNITGLGTPAVREKTVHTFHIYAIRTTQRNELKKFLASKGIETLIHYPTGLPYTQAYQSLQHQPDDFPVTSQLQDEVLSLPLYPELTEKEVTYVTTNILNYFSR